MQNLNWPTGITTAGFIRDYWQQKPLLIRGALPGFQCPLTPDEFVGLTLRDGNLPDGGLPDEDGPDGIDALPARLIRQNPQGSTSIWSVSNGPFDESELTALPETGWSLLITDTDKYLPEFREFLQPFRFVPDWRIDDLMMSYAPAGASVGAHIDAYDVFLFQASGHRRWSITETGPVDRSYVPDQDIRVLANFQPDQTWDLAPGDLLYLPPGVPHHGVSLDNDCMTWSVGFRAPRHTDYVAAVSDQIFAAAFAGGTGPENEETNPDDRQNQSEEEPARFTDPGFEPRDHPGEISTDALENFRRIWDRFANPDAATFARLTGAFLTANSGAPEMLRAPVDDMDALKAVLKEPGTWETDSFSRFAFVEAPTDRAVLFVNGQDFDCSLTLARTLTDTVVFDSAALIRLCQASTDDAFGDAALLQTLIEFELLLPLEAGPEDEDGDELRDEGNRNGDEEQA